MNFGARCDRGLGLGLGLEYGRGRIRKYAGIIAAAGLLISCSAETDPAPVAESNATPEFSGDRIRADINFLADDALEGRDTGSAGYRIAANYVAARFDRLGLTPVGGEAMAATGGTDSFLQEVPFQTARLDDTGTEFTVTYGGETRSLVLFDDFIASGNVQNPAGTAAGPVVFAGYGIHAPGEGWDDFADIDVAGKVALVFTGAPSSLDTETRAHFGSNSTKAKALASRGAVGLVTVVGPSARFSYTQAAQASTRPNFDWIWPAGTPKDAAVKASAMLADARAAELFAAAGQDLEAVKQAADSNDAMPRFDLPVTAALTRKSVLSDPFTSPNVAGLLEGSDPVLRNEVVVVSAHLDHIGVTNSVQDGDTINNGALDNASGASVMMEVAHAYAALGKRPKRSVLFLAVTGEEKGLLGAEYFAHFPTLGGRKMVANVNLDMPVLLYNFVDVIAFGAERSSLGPIVERATAKIGIATIPDPMPEQNLFVRSDHYRFVQQGVPSVFLMTGFGVTADGDDGGAIFRNWLVTDYHSPRDEPTLPINYDAARRYAEVNFYILDEIANADSAPTWNPGDFFGETFGK